MSLTAEQRALRLTGIGASESAKVLDLSPYGGGALGVWMEKPTPSRPPIIEPSEDEESPRQEVGTALEAGLRALFTKRTGVRVELATTLRHPELPHILATPDGLALDEDSGLELKLVGAQMAHHWSADSVPDYVLSQVAQGMAVTGRERWYVGALLGGTDFRVYQILRDPEFEAALLEGLTLFWEVYVQGDVAPEASDPDQARELLRLRYPGSEKTACRKVTDPDIDELARWLAEAKRLKANLEEAEGALTNTLCELVGDDYGIDGAFGKFLWYPRRGAPGWKAIAEELAGGAVPVDLIEKHRGEPGRTPKLTMWKPKTERTRR